MDKNLKILIVQDESLLLEAITAKLKLMGSDPISFTNGASAFRYLKNNPDNLPDLIWLDFKLVKMDGIEFVQKLKVNEAWSRIPVIVVSNSASNKKVKKMMELGVKQYYLKADYRLADFVKTIIFNSQTLNSGLVAKRN